MLVKSQSQKPGFRLGFDVSAVASVLLVTTLVGPSLLSSSSKSALADQMSKTLSASNNVTTEIYSTLTTVTETGLQKQNIGLVSHNTQDFDLQTIEMSAFADIE
ncbi:MAG: hypothetical protein ACRBCJ_01325 [Hyphomicrobiaceae bacterium]